MLLKLTILALVVASVFGARPGWNRPSSSASVIRWNGCASNDETYAILAIQDGSNPKSTFTHSNNVNNVWNILACDITLPGNLVMQFGREIVVGASTVNRPNAIRFNVNSDGVEDLEFNKNGNWVSLTGLVSSQNAPGSTTNFAARNNLVAPLNGVATNPAFGSAFSSNKNNPANNCRQGPKVVLGANGVYASLLTSRTYATGAIKGVTAFLCNYDTDVTATAICAAGVYRPVSLVSGASTSFTCNPEANDFAFATVNGLAQYVVSTTCGPNICGVDFTTCSALPAPGVTTTLGTWYCESVGDPASITPLINGNTGVFVATDGAPVIFGFNNNAANRVQIFAQGYVRISTAGNLAAIAPGTVANYNTGGGGFFDYPVFNSAAYVPGSGQVLYNIVGGLMTIQWQGVQVGTLGTYNAQITLSTAAGSTTPIVLYTYNGDGGVGTVFDTFAGGILVNQAFGCTFSAPTGPADVNVVLPYKALGFSLAGLDTRGRFRLMNFDPAVGLSPYYSIIAIPGSATPALPPAISVPPASYPGGFAADVESGRFTATRCCRAGTRVTGSVLASGSNAMVFYVQYTTFAGALNIDIIARGLTGGTTTWVPATQVSLSTAGTTIAAGGPIPQRGFVGTTLSNDPNVDIRGIVSTYVSPNPGVAGTPNLPMVVFSRRQPSCRYVTGDTMTPGTTSGQLFEYIAGICKDVTCATGVDWRILADSNQLASGNLAEVYTSVAARSPLPELLSLSVSAKTGFPVLAVGSNSALPVVLECLDYQCNNIQSTVGDDYLGGHWGEGFVVPGQKQLTLVSQAAWGNAPEMKPYAQQWNAFTTAPDGLTLCNAANAGKSFNVFGRVYICTRLPRTPQGVTAGTNPTTPFNRPIASAIFQWTEVGGRARLYATENAA